MGKGHDFECPFPLPLRDAEMEAAMEQLTEILKTVLDEQLMRIIISNPRKSMETKKMEIRPFEEKGEIWFQFSSYRNNQVFHSNYDAQSASNRITQYMKESYKQMEIWHDKKMVQVLVSKKGKVTIKEKKNTAGVKIELSHNRKKEYILQPEEPIPFLVELGVQTKDGKIVDKKYKKFRQINRFLEFIQDVLPELPKDKKLTIIDFGCGKSYLTFAVYYFLKIMHGYDVQMIGLDLKKDVIEHCNKLAEQFGYRDLAFLQGDISSYEGVDEVDMVLTLHACDTATDYALDKAVRWGANVILSVPCCQHELNQQISSNLLQPVIKYGILRERISALMTDGLRANLLEQMGYDVQILEFIDMEHTPKNLLIRGVKKKRIDNGQKNDIQLYKDLCKQIHFHGTLEHLLKD